APVEKKRRRRRWSPSGGVGSTSGQRGLLVAALVRRLLVVLLVGGRLALLLHGRLPLVLRAAARGLLRVGRMGIHRRLVRLHAGRLRCGSGRKGPLRANTRRLLGLRSGTLRTAMTLSLRLALPLGRLRPGARRRRLGARLGGTVSAPVLDLRRVVLAWRLRRRCHRRRRSGRVRALAITLSSPTLPVAAPAARLVDRALDRLGDPAPAGARLIDADLAAVHRTRRRDVAHALDRH